MIEYVQATALKATAALIGVLMTATTVTPAMEPSSPGLSASQARTAVVAYAEHMINHGRDRIGQRQTPLFASALNRQTGALGPFPSIDGVREHDRAQTGSNAYHNLALYGILYRLSEAEGKKRYHNAADDAIAHLLTHGQSSKTGLLAWGEHAFMDFTTEAIGGKGLHEIQGPWPYWDASYSLAPDACRSFLLGLWNHQVADQTTGDFSRHADWRRHKPGRGAEFPRYAGQMIEMWAEALAQADNRDWSERTTMVKAIEVVFARMEANHQTPSGHLLAGTDRSHRHISWPGSNLELARCLWQSAPQVPRTLAQRMTRMALRLDGEFIQLPHDLTPESGGFVATVDVRSGEPRSRNTNRPFTTSWASGYGFATHARMALRCLARYKQVADHHPQIAARYRRLISITAEHYLRKAPDPSAFITPGTAADVGQLLLAAEQLSGGKRFLDRAQWVGNLALGTFFDDTSPLPKASNRHEHYEAITGGPDLMAFYLDLADRLDR